MNFKKPKFWDYKKPNLISYILIPFTFVIILNNFISVLISKKKNNIKTICVGNIYIGGTGKTPTVIKFYQLLKKLGYKVVTAKKFYDSQLDEITILKDNTDLILDQSRKKIIDKALRNQKSLVIFDDGLQDRKIEYDINFVCFDAENFIGNGNLIPAGPLREKLKSVKKYDAVVFKNYKNTNLDDQINLIKKYNDKIKIFESQIKITNLKNFDLTKNYLIFSGIGNPSSFKNTLKQNKFRIIEEIIFPDHYEYKKSEIQNILFNAQRKGAEVITTQKDYVKISKFDLTNVKPINIEIEIKNEKDLINFINKSINE